MEGRGIDIERGLLINGELPFVGENLTFTKCGLMAVRLPWIIGVMKTTSSS